MASSVPREIPFTYNVADLFTHMVDYDGNYNMEDMIADYVNNYPKCIVEDTNEE